MSTKGALVIFGSGPGIGRNTAAHFAKKGFNDVFLLSRDQSRLAEDASVVRKAASNANVQTIPIDLAADEATVKKVLEQLALRLNSTAPLECVLYNAARVGPSKIMEWEAKDLDTDLRIQVVNLYVVLQWAIPQLIKTGKSGSHNPAFLTTSGGLYKEPFPFLFSLSAGKAAQHNMLDSFHQQFEPQVHIAAVPVIGMVSDDAKVTTAANVAAEFWKLYEQKKGEKGKFSVDMVDPDYQDGVKGLKKMVQGS